MLAIGLDRRLLGKRLQYRAGFTLVAFFFSFGESVGNEVRGSAGNLRLGFFLADEGDERVWIALEGPLENGHT